MQMTARKVCLIWGLVFVSVGAIAYGQMLLSTIRGTVTDQSKSIVPGVEVILSEVTTGLQVRAVVTDESGNYEMPDLKPGTYRLTAQLPGFKTFVADKVVLEGSQVRRVDVSLEVGEVSDQVTVEAGSAVIATETPELSGRIRNLVMQERPLVRNYYPHSLLVTLPGVEAQNSGWGLRMAGQPPEQVGMGLDGVTNDGTVNLVNKLDFSEIDVVTVGNKADQARVANYNMVSKRGGNGLHGEFFYTHFNSALNARQFFDPFKPTEKEHQSQLAFSGPIFKDRTFFYASFFYLDLPAGSFHRRTVPTEKMRAGDFSQLTRKLVDPLTRKEFNGNIIPANRISTTSQRIQDIVIPKPNLGAGALVSNFGFLHPFPSDLLAAYYPQIRIDHKISDKNEIYGRYIQRYTPYVLPGTFPNYGVWTRIRDHRHWVFSDTHTFSPYLVNTFRFGWKDDFVRDGDAVEGFNPSKAGDFIKQVGLQGVNQRNFDVMGGPRFNIVGFENIGFNPGGVIQNDHLLDFADSVTWSKGRHVWKFGAELKRQSAFRGNINAQHFGAFTFDGFFTGNSYADFLLGLPRESVRLDPITDRTAVAYEFGMFLMDTFKVTDRLTLDLGLRWDYFSSPTFEDGLQFNWDPKTGNVIVPQELLGKVSPLYPKNINLVTGEVAAEADAGNVRPRIGLAYRIGDRLVIRGGYGAFTEQVGYFSRLLGGSPGFGGGPFEIAESYRNEIEGGVPRFQFPNPFPATLGTARLPSQSVIGYPTQTEHGTIHQFHLSVDRQLGDVGVRLSYIGSRSRGLNYLLNINKPRPSLERFSETRRPFPQFVGASFFQNNGANNYNAFQIEADRKVGIISFNAHYTLQKNMSNLLNLENPYSPNLWNQEQWSSRHRAVVRTMIDLPFGKERRYLADLPGPANAVLGGWRMHTVSFFQAGHWFTPTFSGSDPSNTGTIGGLPDRTCSGQIPAGDRGVQKWFDPGCFRAPQAGRFGNSGVNILEGPGLHLHHLSLSKEFPLTERFLLRYVLGISNLFNKPQFAFPRSNISASGAGQITQIRIGADLSMEKTRAREMEMTLRLEW